VGKKLVMSVTRPLHQQDYRKIFQLSKLVEPFADHNFYDQFIDELSRRRGFTIWEGDILLGMVSFSDYIPGNLVAIHFLQAIGNVGSLTRKVLREAFRFPFRELHLPRIMSYRIVGVTDNAGDFLKRLGFRAEGVLKEALQLPDSRADLEIYGMLERECKWL